MDLDDLLRNRVMAELASTVTYPSDVAREVLDYAIKYRLLKVDRKRDAALGAEAAELLARVDLGRPKPH